MAATPTIPVQDPPAEFPRFAPTGSLVVSDLGNEELLNLNDKIDRVLTNDGEGLTDRQKAELKKRFTYHAPKAGQPLRYTALRDYAKDLAALIMVLTPESREQSLALTSLEEAIFWGNAAIARNE